MGVLRTVFGTASTRLYGPYELYKPIFYEKK